MHPAHLANAIAVIREDEHPIYSTNSPTYKALLAQVVENTLITAAKKGLKKAKTRQVNALTLGRLRAYARYLVKQNGVVAADILRHYVTEIRKHEVPGHLFPAVFRTKDFQVIGRKRSAWHSANGREIKVYMEA